MTSFGVYKMQLVLKQNPYRIYVQPLKFQEKIGILIVAARNSYNNVNVNVHDWH